MKSLTIRDILNALPKDGSFKLDFQQSLWAVIKEFCLTEYSTEPKAELRYYEFSKDLQESIGDLAIPRRPTRAEIPEAERVYNYIATLQKGQVSLRRSISWYLWFRHNPRKDISERVQTIDDAVFDGDLRSWINREPKDLGQPRLAAEQSDIRSNFSDAHIVPLGPIELDLDPSSTTTPLRVPWQDPVAILVDGEPSIAAALAWQYQLVKKLYGRGEEERAILDWANDGKNTISVRLLTGPGGSGKSRLAAGICEKLAGKSWDAGFLGRDIGTGHRFSASGIGVFIVVDYPEERLDFLEHLFRAVESIRETPKPVRILLLSRRSYEAWRKEDFVFDLKAKFSQLRIGILKELDETDSTNFLEDTLQTFSKLVGKEARGIRNLSDWLHQSRSHRRPLNLLAAAVHSVLTGRVRIDLTSAEVIDALSDIELRRIHGESRRLFNDTSTLPTLLALAALTPDGLRLNEIYELQAFDVAAHVPRPLVRETMEQSQWWVFEQRVVGSDWARLRRIEPDILSAAFLSKTILRDPRHRESGVLIPILRRSGQNFGFILSRVCYDLTQISIVDNDHLEAMTLFALQTDKQLAVDFQNVVFLEASPFSADFSIEFTNLVIDTIDDYSDKVRAGLNLAASLVSTGRLTEAEIVYGGMQEQLMLLTDTKASGASVLATQVYLSLAEFRSSIGQKKEAMDACDRAIEIQEVQETIGSKGTRPGLANSLRIKADIAVSLDNADEAITYGKKALSILEDRDVDYLSERLLDFEIGKTKISLARSHYLKENLDVAVSYAAEAIQEFRAMSVGLPDYSLQFLAESLFWQGKILKELGQLSEGLEPVEEVIELLEGPIFAKPGAFFPPFVRAVELLMALYSKLERHNLVLESLLHYDEVFQRWQQRFESKCLPISCAGSFISFAEYFDGIPAESQSAEWANRAARLYLFAIAILAQDQNLSSRDVGVSIGERLRLIASRNVARIFLSYDKKKDAFLAITEAIKSLNFLTLRVVDEVWRGAIELISEYIEICKKCGEEADMTLVGSIVHELKRRGFMVEYRVDVVSDTQVREVYREVEEWLPRRWVAEWASAPLFIAQWSDQQPSSCLEMLARTEAWLRENRRESLVGDFELSRVRVADLVFYNGYRIGEIQVSSRSKENGRRQYVISVLFREKDVQVLDGTSNQLHRVAGYLTLTDKKLALDYLKFHCLYVHGERGPWRIVISDRDISWKPEADRDLVRAVTQFMPQTIATKVHGRDDYHYEILTACLYGNYLYSVAFIVKRRGEIELADEEGLPYELPIFTPQYDGIFRIIGHPGEE